MKLLWFWKLTIKKNLNTWKQLLKCLHISCEILFKSLCKVNIIKLRDKYKQDIVKLNFTLNNVNPICMIKVSNNNICKLKF